MTQVSIIVPHELSHIVNVTLESARLPVVQTYVSAKITDRERRRHPRPRSSRHRRAALSENGVVTSARNAAMPPKWLVGPLWNARMGLKLVGALGIKLVASLTANG